MVVWVWTSAVDGVYYPTAFVTKNGKVVYTATHGTDYLTDNFIFIRYLQEPPGVQGTFTNNSTGWEVALVDPKVGMEYHLYAEHKHVLYEAPHGQRDEYTRFVGTVEFTAPDASMYKGVVIGEQSEIVNAR